MNPFFYLLSTLWLAAFIVQETYRPDNLGCTLALMAVTAVHWVCVALFFFNQIAGILNSDDAKGGG